MSPVATKECGRCRETKALTEFWRDRHTNDGRHYVCIECRRGEAQPGVGKGLVYIHKGCGGLLHPDSDNGPGIANYDWYRCDTCRLPGYIAAA